MSIALAFLTNRFNLLEVMSSRLIESRAAYGKYYSDLLDFSNGHIPILAPGAVNGVLTDIVSSESASAFPVIIEVPIEVFGKGRVPALYPGGRTGLSTPGSQGPRVWALERPIALPLGTKILFRSQRELEEHSARPYENVPSDWTLEVRPGAFTGRPSLATGVIQWLQGLPAGDQTSALSRTSRHAGGLTMLALAFENAGRMDAASAASTEQGIALSRIVNFVLQQTDRAGDDRAFEESLFSSMISAVDTNHEEASPSDILHQFAQHTSTAALGCPAGVAPLTKSIQYYREVLANEKEFTGFAAPGGSLVLRSLLLFLLRPSAARLAAYDYGAVGADLGVYALSMYCVGYAAGRKRLNTAYRPIERDVRLAKFEAASAEVAERKSVRKARERSRNVRTVLIYNPRNATSALLPDGNISLSIAGRVVPTYEPARDESEVPLFEKGALS